MTASRLSRALSRPLLALVSFYRVTLSPLLGANCRFQPTCSEYAREALARYGAFRGGWLTLRRIARCHPFGGSGYDPLPDEDGHGSGDAARPDDERTGDGPGR